MPDFLDQLLERDDVFRGERSSPAVIDALAKRFEAIFPDSLLKIWHGGNLTLETCDAHIPGPSEILQLIEDGVWADQLLTRGFVPVLDDHQSNYLVVIVNAPFAYRVAHLPHDDGSRLLYRDLNGFAKALLQVLEAGEPADLFFHETQGDYPADAPRPQSDQDTARALMVPSFAHRTAQSSLAVEPSSPYLLPSHAN